MEPARSHLVVTEQLNRESGLFRMAVAASSGAAIPQRVCFQVLWVSPSSDSSLSVNAMADLSIGGERG